MLVYVREFWSSGEMMPPNWGNYYQVTLPYMVLWARLMINCNANIVGHFLFSTFQSFESLYGIRILYGGSVESFYKVL